MNINKTILDPNLIVFCQQLIKATKEGWELDEMNPPRLHSYWYECQVSRDESILDAVKKSPAESLANARAAKKAKAEGESEENKE